MCSELACLMPPNHRRLGHGAVLERFRAAEPEGGAKGEISLRHAGRMLRGLLEPGVTDTQLEYLLAVLDANQDYMVDFNDVAAGIK